MKKQPLSEAAGGGLIDMKKNNAHNIIGNFAALGTLFVVWRAAKKMIKKYYGKL